MNRAINVISVTPLLDTIGMTLALISLISLTASQNYPLYQIITFCFSYRGHEDRNRRFRSQLSTIRGQHSSFKRNMIKLLFLAVFFFDFLQLFWPILSVFNGFKINVTIYFTSQRFNADLDGADGEFLNLVFKFSWFWRYHWRARGYALEKALPWTLTRITKNEFLHLNRSATSQLHLRVSNRQG